MEEVLKGLLERCESVIEIEEVESVIKYVESLKCCGNCGNGDCVEEFEPIEYKCWQQIKQ